MKGKATAAMVIAGILFGLVVGALVAGDDDGDDDKSTPKRTATASLGAGGAKPPPGPVDKTERPPLPSRAAIAREPKGSGPAYVGVYLYPPENLRVRAGSPSDTSLIFEWNERGYFDTFQVYRWSGSTWLRVREKVTNTSYTDKELTPGTQYWYTVCAVRGAPNAGPRGGRPPDVVECAPGVATGITATQPPPTPTALSAFPSGGKIRFQWTQPCFNYPCPAIRSFEVYRNSSRGELRSWQLDGNTRFVEDDRVQPGVAYIYNVCATGNLGRACAPKWVQAQL
ncbi:MAG TPA: fibronectin type III domain-containing protein [Thermoleophilaceae bacterium]|jgi:hypothetical protein